jgi:hypothetical protein
VRAVRVDDDVFGRYPGSPASAFRKIWLVASSAATCVCNRHEQYR